jgi:RHS repeat-associated protein
VVDSTGALVRSFAYDPWGETIGSTGTLYNPFQFTGTFLDAATGFYMVAARYYRPEWGRFTQVDPLPSSIISINRYAYANCNPANFIDPTGLECSTGEKVLRGAEVVFSFAIFVGALTAATVPQPVEPGVAAIAIGSAGLLSTTWIRFLGCF